ncbi:hypothetical protein GON03_09755 [Nocardioides sp. MAH-18]|uniref:histidine kinase n=2 Tax=Nocardioidaceae TaxID=85015 RepID=A0A6L6XS92_9ACTN|nr:hypothetical protein [Nocardioides sp. MAH-18]
MVPPERRSTSRTNWLMAGPLGSVAASGLASDSTRLGPSTGSAQPVATDARASVRPVSDTVPRRGSRMPRRYGRVARYVIGRLPTRSGRRLRHHDQMSAWKRVRTRLVLALAGLALLAAVAAGFLLAASAPYLSALEVWPLPLVGAAYAATAAYLTTTRPRAAHLTALFVISVGLSAPALSVSLAQDTALWVTVGALAGLVVPAVGWVCVVTLRGDASDALERWLLLLGSALVVGAAVVQVLVADPAAWGWCRCLGNPLAVSDGPGAYVGLRPWLTSAHLAAVGIVVLAVGLSWWSRPGRHGIPELVLLVGLLVAAASWVTEDLAQLAGTPTDDAALGVAIGLASILAAHVLGLSRRRPSRAHVADLLLAARERSEPARIRELVARALGDPGAAVYWWDDDAASYADHLGRPAPPAPSVPAERVLEVESDHRPIARVVSERGLPEDPGILEPVAEALRLSTENRLLQEELAATLTQVRESRSRIVQASDEARRRIERNLHDGAQQLLISTGAKLNLASSQIDPTVDPGLADALTAASDELGRALDELRTLAHGITPTALVHGTLPDALEDLALRSPVPATLQVEGSADVAPEAAATAYFVVGECLANVAKHADASTALVHVALADPLRVTVRDDGHGGADPSTGSGLKGLVDRVEALGGKLEITTGSTGTTVGARLPNPTPNPTARARS